MAIRYSIASARNQFAAIVHAVEEEKEIELTRRGETVAILLSVGEYERLHAPKKNFWDAYRDFRNRIDLLQLEIQADLFANVREGSAGREIDL